MNPGLFKSLERSRLGASKAGFNSAFREDPTSAAGLHQQEFDAAFADAVTNGSDLLALSQKPWLQRKFCRWTHTHSSRVLDGIAFCLEQSLVRTCGNPSTYLCHRQRVGDSSFVFRTSLHSLRKKQPRGPSGPRKPGEDGVGFRPGGRLLRQIAFSQAV
jgi:hypothetical protein